MKAAVYRGEGSISIEEVDEPEIRTPEDAIIRITHTCICGSDLWFYRGQEDIEKGSVVGHEPMGVVEKTGKDVTSLEEGDRVISPFSMSCGKCEYCRKGIHTSCKNTGFFDEESGAQAEKMRIEQADGTLAKVPDRYKDNEKALNKLLPLTDVMGTGHHAAVSAEVEAGDTAVVIGDGAVGLCAVAASRRLGAEKIIAVGHHEDRLEVAREMGATHTVSSRGEEAVEEVKELTDGGANHVLECVGAESSLETAAQIVRPGGNIGYVGVPHIESPEFVNQMFFKNVTLRGGPAPVRNYLEELMEDVLQGTLDPSPVLNKTVTLDEVPEGYEAMHNREAIKVMVKLED